MARKERNGFVLYHDMLVVCDNLDDKQCATLIRALLHYSDKREIIEMDNVTNIFFLSYKQRIDCDIERYEKICNQNSLNRQRALTSVDERESSLTKSTKRNKKEIKREEIENKKENKKENSLTTIKESESSSFLSVFLDLYDIKPDISSLTLVRDLNFKLVMQAWNDSKWLRSEIKSLRWIVNNYQKIISGEYEDKAKAKSNASEEQQYPHNNPYFEPMRDLTEEEKQELYRKAGII